MFIKIHLKLYEGLHHCPIISKASANVNNKKMLAEKYQERNSKDIRSETTKEHP